MTYCPPCASSTQKAPSSRRITTASRRSNGSITPEVLELIRRKRYFVLHAPRQTGKTSTLLALRDLLEAGGAGDYRCVYVNVEAAQAVREDVGRAMRVILGEMGDSALFQGDGFLDGIWSDVLARFGDRALGAALARWCRADPKPLVLLIDEIDTLIGDTLIAVLRQLRAGYDQRPGGFPQSVVLCGVRDVRDYRIHSSTERAVVTGGSAFNIRAESLRLGDFTEAEVRVLLAQHTEETGQGVHRRGAGDGVGADAGPAVAGHALCARACFGDKAGRDRSRAITAEAVMVAREHLVQSRVVHLDQLADKLQEERVRRVVEPLLSGGGERGSMTRDFVYEVDTETEPARDRRPMSFTKVHLAHVGIEDFRSNPRGELGTRTATLHRNGVRKLREHWVYGV